MFNYRVQRVHWGEIGAVPKHKLANRQYNIYIYIQQYFLSSSASVIEGGNGRLTLLTEEQDGSQSQSR